MSEIEFEDMGGYYANKDFRERTATGAVTRHVAQTNADRIRATTDEELAKLMEHCGCCPPGACPHSDAETYVTPRDCEMCWLSWLKSPVEEGEG